MRIVRYKRSTMMAQGMGCLALGAGSAWMFFAVSGFEMQLFFGFLAITLPVAGAALFRRASGDCIALKFDDRTLHVTTLFGGATLTWPNVIGVRRETMTQSYMFGLIKKDISHHLVIEACVGSNAERRFKLNEHLLDCPRSAVPALIDEMAQAQRRAPSRDAAPSASDEADTGSPGFDPDAVMARYLAKRAPATPAPIEPARRSFGRKVA